MAASGIPVGNDALLPKIPRGLRLWIPAEAGDLDEQVQEIESLHL